jgi:PPOX class probable F420-dependent enzyme
MRRGLTPEDLGDLLKLPLVAVLATHRSDGQILLSPLWHEWSDGGFTMVSLATDVKVRHLRADPHASIVVFESSPPYRGIEVRGKAVLTTYEASEVGRRIASRYAEEDDPGEEFPPGDSVLIRLEPGTLRAWDYADEWL